MWILYLTQYTWTMYCCIITYSATCCKYYYLQQRLFVLYGKLNVDRIVSKDVIGQLLWGAFYL